MSFVWSDYLVVAEDLARKGQEAPGSEAHLRAAVGRAYYAAFMTARRKLEATEGPLGRRDVHAKVRDAYLSGPKHTKRIGERLRWLHVKRVTADYEDHYGRQDLFADATSTPKLAAEVIATLG